MNFTQDDIATIIGVKELECIALRREVAELKAQLNPPPQNVQPIKEAADGWPAGTITGTP